MPAVWRIPGDAGVRWASGLGASAVLPELVIAALIAALAVAGIFIVSAIRRRLPGRTAFPARRL